MPRSGWVAVGAVLAATFGARVGIAALGATVVAVAALAVLAIGPWAGRRWRDPLVAAGIGALAIAVRLATTPAAPVPPATIDGQGPWSAQVLSVGSPREGDQVGVLEVRLVPGPGDGSRASDAEATPSVLLAATLPRYPLIEPGDRIVVEGRARPRPDSDYGRYLERIGAWGTLQVDSVRQADVADESPGRTLERLRRGAGDALANVLPEPEAGLAAGILIGLRDRVDRTLAADFTTAGVSHVVAISGWNIAIVAGVIGALAGRVGRRRRAVVTALAVVAYIVFAGASPSVLRAGVMAGVVLLARESGRAGRAAAALGWAVALLLLAEPNLIGDAGFQLSSLATAGLIAWATPVTDGLQRLGGGRVPRWLAESLGVSFAAQAATLPIVLAAFGRLALISPLVNLLIVPIVAPAMAVGLIALAGGALVLAGAPPILGAVLALPGWVALRVMSGIVTAAAGVPGASLEIEASARLGVAALTVAGLGGLVWRRRRGRRPAAASSGPRIADPPTSARARRTHASSDRALQLTAIALIGTMAVTVAIVVSRPPGIARVTVLDVGQGDAILVEGGSGGRLLVDGGPDPDRLLIELDRRIPPWDRRIDAIVLSHPHEDHVAGLVLLLDRYAVGRVFEPGLVGEGPSFAAWQDRLARPDAPPRSALAAGDRLRVDGVSLDVVWPIRAELPSDPPEDGAGINNLSLVLLGTVGQRRFLLTGDVENDVDPRLIDVGLPRIDLLKIAHHGSRTATTGAFLTTILPRLAIVSAGVDNRYGHPTRATLDRLEAAGAKVFRTDRDGSVTVSFRADRMEVETSPRRAAEGPSVGVAAKAVPLLGIGGGPPSGPATPHAALRAISLACGRSPLTVADAGRAAPAIPIAVGYHPDDDGPLTGGGREPARLHGSPDLVPRARMCRGRRGRLAGRARGGHRHRHRPTRRGDRGPPARRGQAVATGRPGPRPPPWRGIGSVADPARPP